MTDEFVRLATRAVRAAVEGDTKLTGAKASAAVILGVHLLAQAGAYVRDGRLYMPNQLP